jgi:hypothetical protein
VLLAAFAVWRAERPVPAPDSDDQRVGAAQPTPQQEAPNDDAAAAPRVAAGGTPPVSPAATAAATPAPRGTESADVLNGPQVVALGQRAAQEYRRLAQYPPWSRPFTDEGEDPILRDRLVSPITATGEDGAEPTLVVFPQQTSFEAPEPVLLYAYLSVNGSRVAANAISGTLLTEDLQPLAQLAYNDDGSDGDPIAGDQIYTARFDPGPDFAPDLSESFLVRVSAETTEGQPRTAATSFLYSNPHARLTGNYRDAIVNGSLVIDAEVEVFRPGRFHLEGTLYSQDGRRGIGEAHTASELPAGRQWMRLTFFGRIIAQGGIDGPYLLRFLALSTTTAMPNAKNRLVENAHVTGAYRSAQFSDAPFDDPDLRDAADRLERDLQPPGS